MMRWRLAAYNVFVSSLLSIFSSSSPFFSIFQSILSVSISPLLLLEEDCVTRYLCLTLSNKAVERGWEMRELRWRRWTHEKKRQTRMKRRWNKRNSRLPGRSWRRRHRPTHKHTSCTHKHHHFHSYEWTKMGEKAIEKTDWANEKNAGSKEKTMDVNSSWFFFVVVFSHTQTGISWREGTRRVNRKKTNNTNSQNM